MAKLPLRAYSSDQHRGASHLAKEQDVWPRFPILWPRTSAAMPAFAFLGLGFQGRRLQTSKLDRRTEN